MKSVQLSYTITVASGSGSTSTTTSTLRAITNSGGRIKTLVVIPPAGAAYDFALKDANGYTLFDKNNINGNYVSDREISIAKGSYTLEISNADIDGSYAVELLYCADW